MPKRRVIRIDASPPKPKKLRVAAYCRVSTNFSEQETSLQAQRQHWESVVKEEKNWELVDIYWESGVSGTKKETRPELQRMLYDCREGKIDLVVTKSISRFARNTADCLEMVRKLTDLGIHILFEREHLDTREMENEFLLTILSSLAEEESHSISENTKWSIQQRFRSGTYRYSKAPYGYRLQEGNFVIEPEEAEVVRWMYAQVLKGKGTSWIAAELNRRGVLRAEKKIIWYARTVEGIIRNVAYLGDVLMQKTYTDESFKRRSNLGEKTRFYMDHHHAAIIDARTFALAEAALRQRGREAGNISDPEEHQNAHNQHYCFSGKLICGCCGSHLIRITQETKRGPRHYWGCSLHKKDKTRCKAARISEEAIRNAFLTMLYKLSWSRGLVLNTYLEEFKREEREKHRKGECAHRSVEVRERIKNIRALQKYAENFSEEIFSKEAFDAFVDHVTVYSGTTFVFHLTCGLDLREVSAPLRAIAE